MKLVVVFFVFSSISQVFASENDVNQLMPIVSDPPITSGSFVEEQVMSSANIRSGDIKSAGFAHNNHQDFSDGAITSSSLTSEPITSGS